MMTLCLIISRQMEPNNTNVAEEAAVINAQALVGPQPCFLLFYQRKCESTVFPSTGLKWVSLRLATLSGARVVARHRSYASREQMTNKWPFHLEKKKICKMKWNGSGQTCKFPFITSSWPWTSDLLEAMLSRRLFPSAGVGISWANTISGERTNFDVTHKEFTSNHCSFHGVFEEQKLLWANLKPDNDILKKRRLTYEIKKIKMSRQNEASKSSVQRTAFTHRWYGPLTLTMSKPFYNSN